MPEHMRGVVSRLRHNARGPGRHYVVKLFLPWLLPAHVDEAVVLDSDLYVRVSTGELWAQFDRFDRRHAIGLVPELFHKQLYPALRHGFNGGVQFLHVRRLRRGWYGRALLSYTGAVGYLGDQTVYSELADAHPDKFASLSCRYNRQANVHFWANASAYACADGCGIVHGNQPAFKAPVALAAKSGNTSLLRRAIPARLATAFTDCAL
jgi:hypothetical protein